MNARPQELQNEKKDRKRGLIIAFFIQSALIILGILPLISHLQSPEPQQAEFVVMDFTDFKPASKEGAKPQKVKKTTQKKRQRTKRSVPKVKPVPKPRPVPPAPKKKVLTSPEPNPPIKTTPTKVETPAERPMDKPTPVEESTPAPVEESSEVAEAETAPSSESSASDAPSTATESGNGTGKKDNGKLDRGKNNGEVAGDGIFSRRVIHRADVKKITKLEGKIVVELCINRDGRVVMAKPVKGASTIRSNDVIRKAVNLTTKYRFERDPTAPRKQCGKLTYIFEIEKE
ncbi:MAG: hypothetical protein AAF990_06410 [Bacteroidota bacterium]